MIEAALRLTRPGFALAVELSLPARGVTALFGPSGCGKTTLLRALAGLERAVGRVMLDGEAWQDDARGVFVPTHRRGLGYVIQEAALFPHLSVQAQLAYAARRVPPGAHRRIDADEVITLLGLQPLLARRSATLSGGERQRVAIARALAGSPRLLLMDEPLAALDAARKAELLPVLEQLQRTLALPIVYVTHSLDEVTRLADHLVLLRDGAAVAAGPLAELMARPDLPLPRAPGVPDDAGVVIDATVVAHDAAYGLLQLGFPGGRLWLGAAPAPTGTRVRARVLARDVSVTRRAPEQTSILNALPVRLDRLQVDGDTVLLRLIASAPSTTAPTAGDATTPLLARITRRSADALALQPGDALYAQVKGVALN
ncbi:MAG: molybdenum ABC transporter ATP-binding protein [Rubrivivax sp.]